MDRSYRDLLKHSGVYGLGHVLARLASVLLLPVYTSHLTRGDYGVLAILDLTAALLAIVLASGTVRAVTRYHFESDSERERDGLWWTGLGLLVVTCVVFLGPVAAFSEGLGAFVLGESGTGPLVLIALATLALTTVEQLLQAHLRVYKLSELFVVLSLGRLALNIALNLWFLIGLDFGVRAILLGNLIAAAVSLMFLFEVFRRRRGAPRWRSDRLGVLFSYGTPLVVASLLAVAMHQLDRYLLRLFLDLDQVGVYSVAYAIGQGINTLVLHPFSQIWYVAVYELDGKPDFDRVISSVFRFFFSGLALILLGVSLFARPLLNVLVAEEFREAATVIPLVCLAYLFFSLHAHFNLPPLLAKRTRAMIPAHVVGVTVNVAANVVLIPWLGMRGAALASVATFAAFSFSGLAVYRRIRAFDYPLLGGALALLGMCGTYLGWQAVASWSLRPWSTASLAAGLWLVWAAILGVPLLRSWRRESAQWLAGLGGRGA